MPEQTQPLSSDGEGQASQAAASAASSLDDTRKRFIEALDWARFPLLSQDGTGKQTQNMLDIAEAVQQGKTLTVAQVQQTKNAIKLLDSNEIVNQKPQLQQLKDTLAVLSAPEAKQAQRPAARTARPAAEPAPQLATATEAPKVAAQGAAKPKPTPAEVKAAKIDDDRDEFIKNALPVAAALRKSGKPEEAKKLEMVAQAIMQTKSMQPTPAPAQAQEQGKEVAVKDALADVWKAINENPAIKNMPEAKNLRKAGNRLDKEGMLNISVRNGLVVSFVSNFTDNFSRTQQLATPAPEAKPVVAQAAPAPEAKAVVTPEAPAPQVKPVAAQPAPAPEAGASVVAPAAPAPGVVAQPVAAEQPAEGKLKVATIHVTYDNPKEERIGMAAALVQKFQEAGVQAEVVSTKPAQDKGQSVSELKVSYRLDDPNINKVSALFDAAAIMNGSKLREEPGDKEARKEAAGQADERQAKEARQQRQAEAEQRRQAQQQAEGRAKAQQLVEQPAPLFQAYPAYTSFAPSTESGIIESRKVIPHDAPQLNVAISDKGEFGINPKVDQQRLIGDGIASLGKFFDYALPTSGHKIAHVGLAEPGQMRQTEKGWEVVTKGKLAITDTEGNVFKPQVSEAQVIAPTPAATVASMAPAPLQPAQVQAPKFSMSDVPAEMLAKLGVPVAELERTGQLQKLLAGQKTDLLQGLKVPGAPAEVPTYAAKLVLHRDAQGVASLQLDLPKRELEIPQQLMGKEITPAMQEQLKTTGMVPLGDGFRDGKGQSFAAYLAVDPEMKRVVAVRPEGIQLPQEVYGVKLSAEQQKSLLEGKPARIDGMTQPGAKQQVSALVQLDPLNRKLVFRDTRPRQAPEQVITPAQQPPSRRQGVRM